MASYNVHNLTYYVAYRHVRLPNKTKNKRWIIEVIGNIGYSICTQLSYDIGLHTMITPDRRVKNYVKLKE